LEGWEGTGGGVDQNHLRLKGGVGSSGAKDSEATLKRQESRKKIAGKGLQGRGGKKRKKKGKPMSGVKDKMSPVHNGCFDTKKQSWRFFGAVRERRRGTGRSIKPCDWWEYRK